MSYEAGHFDLPCGRQTKDIGINYVEFAVFDESLYQQHVEECKPCKDQYDKIIFNRTPNKSSPEVFLTPDGRELVNCDS